MTFIYPAALAALVLIPLLLIAYLVVQRRRSRYALRFTNLPLLANVVDAAPRWRRQSRFFSPTVDYVLRRATCEVLIVAFPQSVMDKELAAT